MKKCFSICLRSSPIDKEELPSKEMEPSELQCHSSHIDDEEPPSKQMEPAELQWLELPYFPTGSNFKQVRVKKHNNAFTIPAVRLYPDGIVRKIVISFDEEETVVKMATDGSVTLEVDTKLDCEGSIGLVIGRKVVEFQWDVAESPMRFLLSTWVGDGGGKGVSSGSGGGGDEVKDERHGEELEESEQPYFLQIFGV